MPEEKQPHRKLYWKMASIAHGINPYPPGHKKNPTKVTPSSLASFNRAGNEENIDPVAPTEEHMEEAKKNSPVDVTDAHLNEEGESDQNESPCKAEALDED